MVFPFSLVGPRVPQRLDLPDADAYSAEELVELTQTGGLATRIAAGRALAARKDVRAFDVLVEGAGNKHFRYPALEGLRILGDARSESTSLEVINRAFMGAFDRTQAAGILVAIGDPRGSEYLLDRLANRRRDDDRGLAIELCSELRVFDSIPELEKIADDPKDLFRGAALKALAALDPRRFESLLCAIAEDENEDPDVRADVVEALALMEGDRAARSIEIASRSSCLELSSIAESILSEDAAS